MKKLTISFIFFFYSIIAFAQAPLVKQWDYRFGGNLSDRLFAFGQTSDGGYILGGWSGTNVNGDITEPLRGLIDYWMVKIDSVGAKQWDKRFGGSNEDALSTLQQTRDGGYILGGYSKSNAGGDKTQDNWDINQISQDFWVVKTDSAGNKQWDRRFGGIDFDELSSLQQTSDGGYILGGVSNSGISGDKTQAAWNSQIVDYWIVKIDSAGTRQWDKRYGGTSHDLLRSVQQTTDGGYILSGHSYSANNGDKTDDNWDASRGTSDYWIVKIDSAGIKQWDKRYGGTKNDQFCLIQQTYGGGYILGGYSQSSISGDRTQANWDTTTGSNTADDYWIVKVDSLGIKQWDKRFGGIEKEDDFGSIYQTADKGYLISGNSYSVVSGDKSENNLGEEQPWVVKTDSLGNKEWDKTIFNTGHDENAYAIQTKDGCYVIANYTGAGIGGYKTQSSLGDEDYWIIKFCDTTQQCNLSLSPIAANKNIFCSGDSARVCAPSGYASYQWNMGQTDSCIKATLAGNYYVTVTDNNGCSAESNRLAISVHPLPPVAISINGDTLKSFNAVSYQWYLNGTEIPGATSTIHIANQPGSYTVAITDSNGCRATSIPRIISGLDDLSGDDGVRVSQLTVDSWQLTVGNNWLGGVAELFDASGKLVFKSEIRNPQSEIAADVARGVYLLRISSSKGSVVRKLEKL